MAANKPVANNSIGKDMAGVYFYSDYHESLRTLLRRLPAMARAAACTGLLAAASRRARRLRLLRLVCWLA